MTIYYASVAGIKGRRADGTTVTGIIPQFDGSRYASTNCGACSEAVRVVSQTKNVRPGRGTPWPPTGRSIRAETGDTTGGLNPAQTTAASQREYGVPHASPRIGAKSIILDKLKAGYAVDLLVAYGPIDDYMSGSPGFRGNHRLVLTGRNTDTRKGRSTDSLYDGRRPGIPKGSQWIPFSVLFDGASKLDLGGGQRLSSRYGYDDAYYIPSLTNLDQRRYKCTVPAGKFMSYDIEGGVVVDDDVRRTAGFTASCTPPQDYRWPGIGTFRLVRVTSGGREGLYISARKYAKPV